MNTSLLDLKNLQEVDDQARADARALEEGAKRRAAAAAHLKASEDKLAATKAEVEAMHTRHRTLEGEVADLSVRRTTNSRKQMAVKNSGEYTALLKEAEFLSTRINELEDEILELLDRLEKRGISIADQEALVSEEAAAYASLAAETEQAERIGRERLTELEHRRQALTAALPPNFLKQYADIAKTRGGRAVTAATGGMCLACRLGFPPQLYNELQRGEKVLNCPNCGRIIYWGDHPDLAPQSKAQKP